MTDTATERSDARAGEPPRLAPGVELLGAVEGSGFKVPPLMVRRPDGQLVQLHPLLYAVAAAADGRRSYEEIAAMVGERFERELVPEDARYLVEEKLRALGVTAGRNGPAAPVAQASDPLLALKFKTRVVPERVVRAVTALFRPLFWPPVIVIALCALVAGDVWLFAVHGIAQSARQFLYDPALILLVLGLVVLSAAFHECGHATGTAYGGARPGVMGFGIYLVWPAFYTDITDSHRLGRGGRLRADLGGVYFNVVFILVTLGAYFATGFEPLLVMVPLQHIEIVHQFLPFLRLDGYYILADLTGVHDMFGRIRPVLESLVPGKPIHPRAAELKGWARAVVTGWVLLLIPIVTFMFAAMAMSAPRLFATAWQSFNHQYQRGSDALAHGNHLLAALSVVQAAALLLPSGGMAVTFARLGRRLGGAAWRGSGGRPAARGGLVLAIAAAAIFVAYLLWPHPGNYRPIGRDDRGTIQGALAAFSRLANGHPTQASAPEPPPRAHGRGTTGNAPSPGADQHGVPANGAATSSASNTTPAATGVTARALADGSVALSWTNPAGADADLVRRGPAGACPGTPAAGTAIGGQGVRTSQPDTTVVPGHRYCYGVFVAASGAYSSPATAEVSIPGAGSTGDGSASATSVGGDSGGTDGTANSPPPPVSSLRASTPASGGVVLSWSTPSSVDAIVVRRGSSGVCPTIPTAGVAVGPTSPRSSETDTTARAASDYCYSVFTATSGRYSKPASVQVSVPPAQ